MVVYKPAHFGADDEAVWRLIDAYPFATLIAGGTDVAVEPSPETPPTVTHLPLLVERDADGRPVALLGHIARRNGMWPRFVGGGSRSGGAGPNDVVAIFQGPDAYITPTWYGVYDVPTWNYAVAHVRARVELVTDEAALVPMLGELTRRFEPVDVPGTWKFGMPEDLAPPGALAAGIVGLRLVVTGVDAKFKLGQNRSQGDQEGVAKGLEARAGADLRGDLAMATLMRERIAARVKAGPER